MKWRPLIWTKRVRTYVHMYVYIQATEAIALMYVHGVHHCTRLQLLVRMYTYVCTYTLCPFLPQACLTCIECHNLSCLALHDSSFPSIIVSEHSAHHSQQIVDFLREAKEMMKFDHPRIVKLLSVCTVWVSLPWCHMTATWQPHDWNTVHIVIYSCLQHLGCDTAYV